MKLYVPCGLNSHLAVARSHSWLGVLASAVVKKIDEHALQHPHKSMVDAVSRALIGHGTLNPPLEVFYASTDFDDA